MHVCDVFSELKISPLSENYLFQLFFSISFFLNISIFPLRLYLNPQTLRRLIVGNKAMANCTSKVVSTVSWASRHSTTFNVFFFYCSVILKINSKLIKSVTAELYWYFKKKRNILSIVSRLSIFNLNILLNIPFMVISFLKQTQ